MTICGVIRFADPTARRLGSFLLLVITLMLLPVVCAKSQIETKDTDPSDSFGIADAALVVLS